MMVPLISAASVSSILSSEPRTGRPLALREAFDQARSLLGSELSTLSRPVAVAGSDLAHAMFGRGRSPSGQDRRARKITAAAATCAQRGSMSMPHSDRTMAGAASCGLDALVMPCSLQHVVSCEQEMPRAACGVEDRYLVEVGRIAVGGRGVDEER